MGGPLGPGDRDEPAIPARPRRRGARAGARRPADPGRHRARRRRDPADDRAGRAAPPRPVEAPGHDDPPRAAVAVVGPPGLRGVPAGRRPRAVGRHRDRAEPGRRPLDRRRGGAGSAPDRPEDRAPPELRARPGTVLAYQFFDQPFELALRADPAPPQVHTESRTTVSLDAARAEVETALACVAAHGRLFELGVVLPRGLELDSAGPRDVVESGLPRGGAGRPTARGS